MTSESPIYRRAAVVAVTLSCLFLGCRDADARLSASEVDIIERWLLCEECIAGERDSVARLGDRAVADLANRLRGPAPMARDVMWRRIQASYIPDSALTRDDYVGLMLENFVALYQKRAASGLSAIGTERAIEVLRNARDSADARLYRSDVVRVVEEELDRAEFEDFTGSLSDTSVRFGERVVVRPGAVPWSDSESVVLTGSPFGDSLLVHGDTDSLVFVAVAEWGSHTLRIVRQGSQQVTQIAPLRITSLRYNTHPPAPVPVVTASVLPQRRYLVLGVRPVDTMDHFRFQPTVDLPLTAVAESPGRTAPSLTWRRCPSPTLVSLGNTSILSGVVVNEVGIGIPDARVSIPATAVGVLSGPTGRFSLANIPPSASSSGFVNLRLAKQGSRPRDVRVQAGADSVQLTLLADSVTDRAARTREALSVVIPGDSCRILRVSVPDAEKPAMIRLGLTSP
jgi:hypothetical protein